MIDWYSPLRSIISRGSQIDPVGGLAGLHAAREQHLGQFFTPETVVRFMWRIVGLTDARADSDRHGDGLDDYYRNDRWHVLDNSFGSGRMFWPADPKLHVLHGIEVDEGPASAVIEAARTAGFGVDLHVGSMLDFKLVTKKTEWRTYSDRCHVGVINPPFSIHFDSPNVSRMDGIGSFGRFGPGSSCMSQIFAVAQALEMCERVVAVVPRSFAETALAEREDHSRLVAVFHLPRSVFRGEGAEVDVSVLLWDQHEHAHCQTVSIDLWPISDSDSIYRHGLPNLHRDRDDGHRAPELTSVYNDTDGRPATTLALTGDTTVRIAHDGRRIKLVCNDAATYVQAMNRVLVDRITKSEHRQVRMADFIGRGRLDVECLLMQPDAGLALHKYIVTPLREAGLTVELDGGFARYFNRRRRRHAIDVAPFGHTACVADGGFADWLRAQPEVRLNLREGVDASTKTKHQYHSNAMIDCWRCSGTGVEEEENDDVVQQRVCPTCVGARVVRAGSRYDYGTVTSPEFYAERGYPQYKESRHTRRWNLAFEASYAGLDEAREVSESWLEDEMLAAFDFPDFVPRPDGWQSVHPSISVAHSRVYADRMRRAIAEGCSTWLWSYQLHDLCEIACKRGAIIAWEMGLGKARLAAALCLLGGKHNLITVETRLIKEMENEFRLIGLPAATWQTITKPEQLARLRRINLISYDKLKSTLPGKKRPPLTDEQKAELKRKRVKPRTWDVRHTFADALRRRIHTHVCDEGHLLANHTTQQSRAVWQVSSKGRRYLLTGTPISNYPRDILRLLQWVAGDGTARQIFGDRWPLMQAGNIDDLGKAPRGVDEFREMFVTLQWVTNEFVDEMEEGAKREVPVIADVPGFRKVVAPHIKRRVAAEPDVAQHVKIPVPTHVETVLSWDPEHLALYNRVAQRFVDWYKREYERLKKAEGEDAKGAHLIAVLRNLYAVYCAANHPHEEIGDEPAYTGGDTSKERFAVARVLERVAEDRKVIVLAEKPAIVERLMVRLRAAGLDVVPFHGGIPVTKRVESLDKRFREGPAQVLAATKGCLQTGYNLACASAVLFFDRTWTPKTEHQAAARVLRPQQRRDVVIEKLMLRGSIDEYQRQMVDQKALAMASGLDYGAGTPAGTQFRSLDSIFAAFVRDFDANGGARG